MSGVVPRGFDVAEKGLCVRHVLVGFHPRGGCDLPPARPDPLPDPLLQLRRVFVHDLIDGGLRLAEAEVRIFVHDVQHGGEGGDGGGHGFRPGPHPVHVDVGVTRQNELIAFRVGGEGKQRLLCPPRRGFRHRPVLLQRPFEDGERGAHLPVVLPVQGRGETDRELDLGQDPDKIPGGRGDVHLLLPGHAEGLLVPELLPVAADLLFHRGIAFIQVWHGISFLKMVK